MIVYPPRDSVAAAPSRSYYHFGDGVLQQSDPRPPPDSEASLPEGWVIEFDADGDAYFLDHNSGG